MNCLHPVKDKLQRLHPCGQCRFCRMKYTKDWAIRVNMEKKYYPKACSFTLTYGDDEIKKNPYNSDYWKNVKIGSQYSLQFQDYTDFVKRLRDKLGYPDIKLFSCGEYGSEDNTQRPHFHVILLGYDFPDKFFWRISPKSRKPLYRSPFLESLWLYGHSEIGDADDDAVRYVANYISKKLKGKSKQYYDDLGIVPPAGRRSNGISKRFCEDYKDVLKRDDFVFYKGKKCPLPRYCVDKVFDENEKYARSRKYINLAKEQMANWEHDHKLKGHTPEVASRIHHDYVQSKRDEFDKKFKDKERN